MEAQRRRLLWPIAVGSSTGNVQELDHNAYMFIIHASSELGTYCSEWRRESCKFRRRNCRQLCVSYLHIYVNILKKYVLTWLHALHEHANKTSYDFNKWTRPFSCRWNGKKALFFSAISYVTVSPTKPISNMLAIYRIRNQVDFLIQFE